MENPEEVLQSLEDFAKLKPKDIPRELEEYLEYVAKTGDPVYQWSVVKCLFREKLISVITDFYESCPTCPNNEFPPCPNVEPFNYESMKTSLVERLESFSSAPFTVQRLCELLTGPTKEYSRVDKFMRAVEKNILVVSTREPGSNRRSEVQSDFLMNGVMDGRSLDLGEAIETVSSDGLMHGDEHEAQLNDTSKSDCKVEDIDLEDHSEIDTKNIWNKGERESTNEENIKNADSEGGDSSDGSESDSSSKEKVAQVTEVASDAETTTDSKEAVVETSEQIPQIEISKDNDSCSNKEDSVTLSEEPIAEVNADEQADIISSDCINNSEESEKDDIVHEKNEVDTMEDTKSGNTDVTLAAPDSSADDDSNSDSYSPTQPVEQISNVSVTSPSVVISEISSIQPEEETEVSTKEESLEQAAIEVPGTVEEAEEEVIQSVEVTPTVLTSPEVSSSSYPDIEETFVVVGDEVLVKETAMVSTDEEEEHDIKSGTEESHTEERTKQPDEEHMEVDEVNQQLLQEEMSMDGDEPMDQSDLTTALDEDS